MRWGLAEHLNFLFLHLVFFTRKCRWAPYSWTLATPLACVDILYISTICWLTSSTRHDVKRECMFKRQILFHKYKWHKKILLEESSTSSYYSRFVLLLNNIEGVYLRNAKKRTSRTALKCSKKFYCKLLNDKNIYSTAEQTILQQDVCPNFKYGM